MLQAEPFSGKRESDMGGLDISPEGSGRILKDIPVKAPLPPPPSTAPPISSENLSKP